MFKNPDLRAVFECFFLMAASEDEDEFMAVVAPRWMSRLGDSTKPLATSSLRRRRLTEQSVLTRPIFDGEKKDVVDVDEVEDVFLFNEAKNLCEEKTLPSRPRLKPTLPISSRTVASPVVKASSVRRPRKQTSDPVALFRKHQADWARQKRRSSAARRRPLSDLQATS